MSTLVRQSAPRYKADYFLCIAAVMGLPHFNLNFFNTVLNITIVWCKISLVLVFASVYEDLLFLETATCFTVIFFLEITLSKSHM